MTDRGQFMSGQHSRHFITMLTILMYLVGLSGLLFSTTKPLFIALFPYFLLLNGVLLALSHTGSKDWSSILVFLFIFLAGFTVEVFGVSSGLIFGKYQYGNSLGIKILNTPLIIGLNWLMLVYATSGILDNMKFKTVYRIILASLLMLGYDLVLEPVAPKLGMWFWEGNSAPFLNYLAWLCIALILHSWLKINRIIVSNPFSSLIFICQFLFFVALNIFLP